MLFVKKMRFKIKLLLTAVTPLKTEFLHNFIYKSSPYLRGNTLLLTTKTNRLMLFRETVAVLCENHMAHTNTLCGQNAEL
jgi:hypothetical protein